MQQAKQLMFDSLKQLYIHIWLTREHVSFLTGDELKYTQNTWVNMFAHVLAKGRFPKFKFNPDNVVLLQPHEHHIFDHGTNEQRTGECWDKLFDLETKLWLEYRELDSKSPIIKRVLNRL